MYVLWEIVPYKYFFIKYEINCCYNPPDYYDHVIVE